VAGAEIAEIASYAALGDSFTAGAGCPDGARWTDRLAAALPGVDGERRYRNFAVDGANSADVLAQLRPALALEPDLVTVVCGVNDVLLSVRPDTDGYARNLATIFARLLRRGSPAPLLITATAPEGLDFLELGPRTRRRLRAGLARLNEHTRRLAAEHGAICLEVAGHPGLDDPENFQDDGLHPSAVGHARAALAFESLLDETILASKGAPR
jgi:lysophospholipase L1-like esterase